jgi:hypothetical protein
MGIGSHAFGVKAKPSLRIFAPRKYGAATLKIKTKAAVNFHMLNCSSEIRVTDSKPNRTPSGQKRHFSKILDGNFCPATSWRRT